MSVMPAWFQAEVDKLVDRGILTPVPDEPGRYTKRPDGTGWKLDFTNFHVPDRFPGDDPEKVHSLILAICALGEDPTIGTPIEDAPEHVRERLMRREEEE